MTISFDINEGNLKWQVGIGGIDFNDLLDGLIQQFGKKNIVITQPILTGHLSIENIEDEIKAREFLL